MNEEEYEAFSRMVDKMHNAVNEICKKHKISSYNSHSVTYTRDGKTFTKDIYTNKETEVK